MKLKIIFAAAIAALAFASCSKDTDETAPIDTNETTSVYLKLDKGNVSRAVSSSIVNDGDPVSINNGYLYFTNSMGQITNVFPIHDAVAASELESGKTFTNIKSNAARIYFFGNIPPIGVNMSSTGNIDDVLRNVLSMPSQIDHEGGVSNVLVYGLGDVIISQMNSLRTANVTVEAQVARIEIPYLMMQGNVTGFKLDGIFVNNFYNDARLDGFVEGYLTYYAWNSNFIPGDPSVPMYDPQFATVTHDYDESVGLGYVNGPTYLPTSGAVWAYNVFTADGNVPHIVLKFSEIMTNNGAFFNSPQFITVKGFNDASTGERLSRLEKGKVYKFAAGIPVNDSNFTSEPELESVDVDVTVKVMAWKEHIITPEI